MVSAADQTRNQVLERRLARELRQVEALENQRDLTLDEGQKVLLDDRIGALWSSIEELKREIERAPAADDRLVTRPGFFRYFLDRYLPRLHAWLTIRVGVLSLPSEWQVLHNYLRTLRSAIAEDLRVKTYIEPAAKGLPPEAEKYTTKRTGFLTPVQQLIREIIGVSHGGDAQSARISALSRKSRLIRNIVQRVLKADEPLVLLGDPGTGKSMTLQQAAMLIAEREGKRLFPTVCLYIRLGEFQAEGPADSFSVWSYVKKAAPRDLRPFLDSLDALERLVIFFDGMDEMNRARYNEYTAALSVFAGSRKGTTKTLFSCRITDFTPRFQHNRLVLLPFNRVHIFRYLKGRLRFPLQIGGKRWSARQLAGRLAQGDLPMQADNPFVLWLLCNYLREEQDWPKSRVHLLGYYNQLNYRRKLGNAQENGEPHPAMEEAFQVWGRIAFAITERNQGAAMPASDIEGLLATHELPALRAGLLCGVLQESLELETQLLRFEHHRFQEYFTALYLSQGARVVSGNEWLEKLDAPRWQETLFNLVLMRGGREALAALEAAIAHSLSRLRRGQIREGSVEATREETLLADRVELTSRILQQAQQQSEEIPPLLRETFQQAAYWLADHGNPITKVKMLWTAKIVPGVDTFRLAREALASDVNWLRQQALIITAAASETVGTGALKEDLFHSFASGTYLNRLAGFVRVCAAVKSRRSWSVLLGGLLLNLVQLLAAYGLLATAHRATAPTFSAMMTLSSKTAQANYRKQLRQALREKDAKQAKTVRQAREQTVALYGRVNAIVFKSGQFLTSLWFLLLANGAILLTLLYVLRQFPGRQLLAMQGVGYFCLLLPFLWWPIWLGDGSSLLVLFFFAVISAIPLACAFIWLLTLAVHGVTLGMFAACGYNWMGSNPKRRMLLEAMWQNCGYRAFGIFTAIYSLGVLIMCLPVFVVLGLASIDWKLVVQTAGLFPGWPQAVNGAVSATIYAQILGCLARVVWGLRRREQGARLLEALVRWTGVCLGTALLVISIWGLTSIDRQAILELLMTVCFLVPFLPPRANLVVSLALYAEVVGCLLSLLAGLRQRRHKRDRALEFLARWTGACLGVMVVIFVTWYISAFNWLAVVQFIESTFAVFPQLPSLVNIVISGVLYAEIVGVVASIVRVSRRRYRVPLDLRFFLRWTAVCSGLGAATFVAWGIYRYSAYLARSFAVILLLAVAAVWFLLFGRLMRGVGPALALYLLGPIGRASYDRTTWIQQLAKLDPPAQAALLRRTMPDAVNLQAHQFLALLQEAETSVQEEPAKSAYWAKRYQIEQIVRQEKVG
jgi:NACHT domain-containing protein